MNMNIVRAEALVSAIKTLPRLEQKIILGELMTDLEDDFSQVEWRKIEKLTAKKGKIYDTADGFLKALHKI